MKTFIPVSIIIISLWMINACSYRKLPPKEFNEQLKMSHGILIDVRTPLEFDSGYISEAVNMNIQSDHFSFQLDSLDKSRSYFIYCGIGKRSAKAVMMMEEKGFKNVFELKGGLAEWKKENYPVSKKTTPF